MRYASIRKMDISNGEGLGVAEVEAAVDPPARRGREGVDDVGEAAVVVMGRIVAEVVEKLALKDVPPAIEPGVPQPGRQGLQLADVIRLGLT